MSLWAIFCHQFLSSRNPILVSLDPLRTPPQLTPTSPYPCQLLTPMTTESLAVTELQKANCCMMQTFLRGSDNRPQKELNVTYFSSSFTKTASMKWKTAAKKSSPPATSIFFPAFCRPTMVPIQRSCLGTVSHQYQEGRSISHSLCRRK